jgi:hypothetical protein
MGTLDREEKILRSLPPNERLTTVADYPSFDLHQFVCHEKVIGNGHDIDRSVKFVCSE